MKVVLSFVFFLLLSTQSWATIITGAVTGGAAANQGGQFVELILPFNPPNGPANTVGNDTFQTPNLYGFNEGQNIVLASDLGVNVGSGGTIASGTTVASHYIFFDPRASTTQTGWVDFDAEVLGIITSRTLLNNSDSLLNNNVNYLSPAARGLESGDSALIDAGLSHRVNVDWRASTPGDFVRVITAFSQGGTDPCSNNPPGVGGCPADAPVPATPLLFGLGLGLLGVVRKKKFA